MAADELTRQYEVSFNEGQAILGILSASLDLPKCNPQPLRDMLPEHYKKVKI